MSASGLQEPFFREIFNALPHGVCIIDAEAKVKLFNRAGAAILNARAEDQHYTEFFQCVDLDSDQSPVEQTLNDGLERSLNALLVPRSALPKSIQLKIIALPSPDDADRWAMLLFHDNADELKLFERMRFLEEQCTIDALTDLPNRVMVESNLDTRFHEYQRFGWQFGVMMIDIDHFKRFNDKYGHDVGDAVLQSTAKVLSNQFRAFDIAGRWGGEEFVAIVANVDKFGLLSAAERMRYSVESNRVMVGGEALQVTVSVGAVMVRQDDDVESIIHRADHAMYQSKDNGRNRVTVV